MPPIRSKSSGFSTFVIRKGAFKTSDGQAVHLIMDQQEEPYLLIQPKVGKPIYYSSFATDEAAIKVEFEKRMMAP